RADRRAGIARGSARPHRGRGRAWPVHRARTCRCGGGRERRTGRRAALSLHPRTRRVFMFTNLTARTPIKLALGVALALCVGAADAQQPSPSAITTAKELITVKGAVALYDPLVPGVIE